MTSARSHSKLGSIQALRGVAALMVVLVHAEAALNDNGMGAFLGPILSRLALSGVDIFFAISGFLMVVTTADRSPGWPAAAAFFRARVVRIVPLYWLLTAALVLALVVRPSAFNKLHFEWGHTLASFLILPTVKSAGAPFPVLFVGWTLSYEMLFYAVFAALLLVTRRWIVPAMAALFALACLAGGNTLLLEFVLGCLVGEAYLRGARLTAPQAVFLLAVTVGLEVLLAPLTDPALRIISFGVPSALLVAGCALLERAGGWPSLPSLQRLGDSSYSLYLTHALAVPLVARVLAKSMPGSPVPVDVFVMLATAVMVGWWVFMWIERPLGRWLSGRGASSAKRALRATRAA